MCTYGHIFLPLLGIYLEVEILHYMGTMFNFFKLFSTTPIPIYTPTINA